MHRIAPLTKQGCAGAPNRASTIAPEVKLTFARDVIDVAIPLFTNKSPSNPDPGTTTGETGTSS